MREEKDRTRAAGGEGLRVLTCPGGAYSAAGRRRQRRPPCLGYVSAPDFRSLSPHAVRSAAEAVWLAGGIGSGLGSKAGVMICTYVLTDLGGGGGFEGRMFGYGIKRTARYWTIRLRSDDR